MNWFEDIYNRQIYFDLYVEADRKLAIYEVSQIIELLDLNPTNTILDVCCGYGRHAIEFAKKGFKVTGIDLSSKQIEYGKSLAGEEGVEIHLIVGDAQEMTFSQKFDVALNLFTSFGFFQDDQENLALMERMAFSTAPGGVFFLEMWNRERQIREFKHFEVESRSDGIQIEKNWQFDLFNGRLNWENIVNFPNGYQENWHHSIRVYTLVELNQMISQVGFELVNAFGDYDGNDYTLDSPKMIIVAKKKE